MFVKPRGNGKGNRTFFTEKVEEKIFIKKNYIVYKMLKINIIF